MAPNPIKSILPQPTEVSILTSVDPFPEEMRPFTSWKDGLKGRSIGDMYATSEPLWCPPGERDVYDPAVTPFYEFYPLKTNLPHGCKGFVDDEGRWRIEAEADIAVRVAWAMGRELWTGVKTGSTSFQSSTTAVSTTDPLLPISAISKALMDYSECTQGAKAFIHVPVVLLGHLSVHGYFERQGDKLKTAEGHIVVPGPGYPTNGNWGPYEDERPPGPGEDGYNESTYAADLAAYHDSGTFADEGQCWVYVTGSVEAPDPEFLPRTIGDDVNREEHVSRMNEFYTTARAVTIARFDPGCVFAALVTIPGNA